MICSNTVNSQNKTKDSLWTIWSDNSLDITNRIDNFCILITDHYLYNNPDSAFLLNEILKDSILKYKLFEQYELQYLQNKGYTLSAQAKYDQSITLNEDYLQKAISKSDSFHIATAMNNLAVNYYYINKHHKALPYYKKQLIIQEKIGDIEGQAKTHFNVGLTYQFLGDLPASLKCYQNTLSISEENNIPLYVLYATGGISGIYYEIGDYDKSEVLYNKMLEKAIKLDNKRSIAVSYQALGTINIKKKNYELAITNLNYSLELFSDLNMPGYIGTQQQYLAECYLKLGQLDKAKEKINVAITLLESINSNTSLIESYIIQGQLHIMEEEYEKAVIILNRANKLNEEEQSSLFSRDAHHYLYIAYKCLENISQSLIHLEKNKEYQNKTLDKERLNDILKMQLQYQFDIKERELENKRLIEESKYLKQRFRTNLLLGMSALLLLALVILYFFFKQKEQLLSIIKQKNEVIDNANKVLSSKNVELDLSNNKLKESNETINEKNKLLLESNETINEKNKLLLESNEMINEKNKLLLERNETINEKNKLLLESNHSLSNFAYVAAHDIKAPLRTIGSFAKILKSKYQNDSDDDEFFRFIIEGCNNLSQLISSLLNFSSLTQDLKPSETIEINTLVSSVISKLSISIVEKEASISVMDNLPNIEGHPTLIEQVFLNLINNSIKYSKENQGNQIFVKYKPIENGYIEFCVQDQGIGIPEKQQPKVFGLFSKYHVSQHYSGNGIGLSTCKKIIEYYGGEIWLESEVNKGTSIFFTLKSSK